MKFFSAHGVNDLSVPGLQGYMIKRILRELFSSTCGRDDGFEGNDGGHQNSAEPWKVTMVGYRRGDDDGHG